MEFPESSVGHSGFPILEAVIEPDGTVDEVEFVRQPVFTPPWPEAEEAIVKAIRKWKFEPAVVDGERVSVCMTVSMNICWS